MPVRVGLPAQYSRVVQWKRTLVYGAGDWGSSPCMTALYFPLAQSAEALVLETNRQGFESLTGNKNKER